MTSTTKPWAQRLTEAKATGQFTIDDKVQVRQWNTCAVGENYTKHPALAHDKFPYQPIDIVLDQLGVDFADFIRADNIEGAYALYARIQDRITDLTKANKP